MYMHDIIWKTVHQRESLLLVDGMVSMGDLILDDHCPNRIDFEGMARTAAKPLAVRRPMRVPAALQEADSGPPPAFPGSTDR